MEKEPQGRTPEQTKFSEKIVFWFVIAIFVLYLIYIFSSLISNIK